VDWIVHGAQGTEPETSEAGMERPDRKSEKAPPSEGGTGAQDETRPASEDNEQPRPYPDMVDDTLDDSFPASDPPSWAGE